MTSAGFGSRDRIPSSSLRKGGEMIAGRILLLSVIVHS